MELINIRKWDTIWEVKIATGEIFTTFKCRQQRALLETAPPRLSYPVSVYAKVKDENEIEDEMGTIKYGIISS